MVRAIASGELHRTFELVTLRREAAALRSPEYWKETSDLKRRCQSARTREKDLFATRFDARVEQARRRIIDAAGSVTRDLKPGWAGEDAFSPDVTLRRAEREVRNRHERRIGRIDDFEATRLRDLVRAATIENERPAEPAEAFGRAADRRRERRRSREF